MSTVHAPANLTSGSADPLHWRALIATKVNGHQRQLPTHKDLPEDDGTVPQNSLQTPQSSILSGSIEPWLSRKYPDRLFFIGQDNLVYWRLTDPVLDGCKGPDWCLVLGVPPLLEDEFRRSYVLWEEGYAPLIVIEFVSGNGIEEHDRTPRSGKFWVYEQGIQAKYYSIFDPLRRQVELYHLVRGRYEAVPANERFHLPVAELGLELGIKDGPMLNVASWRWLRWFDANGTLLLTAEEELELERQKVAKEREKTVQAEERAEQERLNAAREKERAEQERLNAAKEKERAEQERLNAAREKERAEQERLNADREKEKAERLAVKLRQLGVEPDQV